MDELDLDSNVLEFGGGDMGDIWGPSELLDTGLPESDSEWCPPLDCKESVVLRDRMITEASLPIQTEHSYCNADPLSLDSDVIIKEEDDDMESECFPAISMSTATGEADGDQKVTLLKRRPEPAAGSGGRPGARLPVATAAGQAVTRRLVLSQSARPGVQVLRTAGGPLQTVQQVSAGQSVLRPQTIVLTAARPTQPCRTSERPDPTTRLSVKIEPSSVFPLPPTPPSSDDGGASPTHSGSLVSPLRAPAVHRPPPKVLVTAGRPVGRLPIKSPLISTQLHKGANDTLNLTEEEKRTLISEGYSVPSRLPLTKSEERSLKKIRRKIKNKISAQESRRKKKEYMDTLERRLDVVAAENDQYQARLAELESQHRQLGSRHGQLEARNALLLRQLQQLQLLVGTAVKLEEQPALPNAVKQA